MTRIKLSLQDDNPIQITGAPILFKTASFFGIKSFTSGTPNANDSDVFVGLNSGELPITISTGSYFNWTLHPNQEESLNNFWVKGQSGDGLYVISY